MLNSILCIEDDAITLMLYKMVLTKASFTNEIITTTNGEEALNYINKLKEANSNGTIKNVPQLIFLDLNMPVMGGWEFLEIFSSSEYAEYNHIKVIILSSTVDPDDLEKSKKYSMVIDFLSKPISRELLEYIKSKI